MDAVTIVKVSAQGQLAGESGLGNSLDLAYGLHSLVEEAVSCVIVKSSAFKKTTIAANPRLPELIIKAHAEAIKRFYDDKAFAMRAYIAYDKQSEADVARIYDTNFRQNLLERIPYVMATAVVATKEQADAQQATQIRDFDLKTVVDNSAIDRIVKEGFFEKLFGAGITAEIDRKSKLAFR